jgi:hypothetical protein
MRRIKDSAFLAKVSTAKLLRLVLAAALFATATARTAVADFSKGQPEEVRGGYCA